jgi:nucleoside-diphosphate kinase
MPTPDLLDPSKEHSLVLIKPDGVRRGLTGEILHRIEQKGFVLKGLKIKKASARTLKSTTKSTWIGTTSQRCVTT